jgi:hypothetical protein
MTTLSQKTDEKRRELSQSLGPAFGEDSGLAAELLTSGLQTSFSANLDGLAEDEQHRYLAALERLPKGGVAAWKKFISPYDRGSYWMATFSNGKVQCDGRHFPTKHAAETNAENFLLALHGAI